MSSFIYRAYPASLPAGPSFQRGALWFSYNLALVTSDYTPDPDNDRFLSDIPSGAIAANGNTGTFPVLTMDWGPGTDLGNLDVSGLRAALAFPGQKWGTVPVPAAPVVAVVFYGIVLNFPFTTALIAYYDDWTGLPFMPDGTDVPLNALPVSSLDPLGDNMVALSIL